MRRFTRFMERGICMDNDAISRSAAINILQELADMETCKGEK